MHWRLIPVRGVMAWTTAASAQCTPAGMWWRVPCVPCGPSGAWRSMQTAMTVSYLDKNKLKNASLLSKLPVLWKPVFQRRTGKGSWDDVTTHFKGLIMNPCTCHYICCLLVTKTRKALSIESFFLCPFLRWVRVSLVCYPMSYCLSGRG